MSAIRISDPPMVPPKILQISSSRVSIPLSLQQAKKYCSPRVALIGDAAHSIHPQAGQGLNLGIADVKQLALAIEKGVKTGTDIGDDDLFLSKEFGSIQQKRNLSMMGAVDAINRIYSTDNNNLVNIARSFGMLAVHGLGPIKSSIAKYAMGRDLR
jgi:ubiquinone biosynthesis monooxygenase Coq6